MSFAATYDLRAYNAAGETIPAFAVMQIAGWVNDVAGVPTFRVVKPTAAGKAFLLNGPSPILPPQGDAGGLGIATRTAGAFALFDPALSPVADQELGPVAGQWWLGTGNGFIVVGDVVGAAGSAPGFPAVVASFRARVVMQPAAPDDNVILGYPTDNFNAAASAFVIANIQVLSGTDPRTNPNNPLEGVLIQNVPAEARTTGVAVKARQSKSTGLWFPDSVSAPANLVIAKLKTDLTVFMATVKIIVVDAPTGSAATVGSELTAINPLDLLAATTPTRYLHAGNANGLCYAQEFAGGWTLQSVQWPIVRPVGS